MSSSSRRLPPKGPVVIKRDQTRLVGRPHQAHASGGPTAATVTPPHPTPAQPPRAAHACAPEGMTVKVERSSETLTELRVTCPCGNDVLIVCEHPPHGGQA